MPNIKSQKKRVKTNADATLRNKSVKSSLRTSLKKAESAIGTDSASAVSGAYKAIDVACKKGVIHKNTANRKKSAIAKKASSAEA